MMRDRYIQQYRQKGILIDTNLLVLFFVGSYDVNFIEQHKRTKDSFKTTDFVDLVRFINKFQKRVTLPHVLTEVSNLLTQTGEPKRSELIAKFGDGISFFEELYVPSVTVAQSKELVSFGLTDSLIAHAVRGNYLFLTEDMRLGGFLMGQGVDVIPFASGKS